MHILSIVWAFGLATDNVRRCRDTEDKLDHPANEYLHDEKGQYLCAVNSLCGGFLTFLP